MARINATTIKSYFQYRCERQLRYNSLDSNKLQTLNVEKIIRAPPWAQTGIEYEASVVGELARNRRVLRPPPTEKILTERETIAFLRRELNHDFAHQLHLWPRAGDLFHQRYNIAPSVVLGHAIPDLIEAVQTNGQVTAFRLIDVKATHVATLFHRIQVAFYSLLLESSLAELGVSIAIDPLGESGHYETASSQSTADSSVGKTQFPLKGYRAQVLDFLTRIAPVLDDLIVEPGRDDTFFHLYFKCEQCSFVNHCRKSLHSDDPASSDLSAVPGLSPRSKRTLWNLGLRMVDDLVHYPDLKNQTEVSWSLRANADLFIARARALADGRVSRLPQRYTYLMPARLDLAIYLIMDHDPVEGRLAALGCLIDRRGEQELCVEVVVSSGAEPEGAALLKIMHRVQQALAEADAYNRARAPDERGWIAHLFLSELSEARDLQAALGRHLENESIRRHILHLLRIFPPDHFPEEPGYKRRHHLPATVLRSVIDTLFALPVQVCQDLRAVTQALARAERPLTHPYVPKPKFERIFSSRLNIDCCRELKSGSLSADEVKEDVVARLRATAALAQWLMAENQATSDEFLRLKKAPFEFQTSFDPLQASDLDLLLAHELLISRSAELAALTRLAQPFEVRRDKLLCMANLDLLGHQEVDPFGNHEFTFWAPPTDRESSIEEEAIDVILTDDNPDLRLDPLAWEQLFVTIRRIIPDLRRGGQLVTVEMYRDTWETSPIRELVDEPGRHWYLDRVYRDFNSARSQNFLKYLAEDTR